MKGWVHADRLDTLSRTQILDQNDWLDALEEAEDAAQANVERDTKRNR